MKYKNRLSRKYHFNKLPFPPKLTIQDAESSVARINDLFAAVRNEISYFHDSRGYLLLGYRNMPALVKSRIQEISPRYIHGLLVASKVEKSMELNSPIGTVPYLALMIIKSFPVEIMKEIWAKSSIERLPGESTLNALRRVIKEYKGTNK